MVESPQITEKIVLGFTYYAYNFLDKVSMAQLRVYT